MDAPTCPPPRSNVQAPRRALPPLSCDSHFHIFGPRAEYDYAPIRSYTPHDCLPEAYRSMARTLGLERMVVVQPSGYGFDHDRARTAISVLGKDRARGVAMIDPGRHDRAAVLALHDAGFRAARFITTTVGGADLSTIDQTARLIAPLGWHLEIYTSPQMWSSLLPIVKALPVEVVFDHMGGLPPDPAEHRPLLDGLLELLSGNRAWVKLCGYRNSRQGFPYSDMTELARIFIAANQHRCVWGSDWPHTSMKSHMPDDGALLDLLDDWAVDLDVRNRILVDNPARLYGFADHSKQGSII